MFSHPRARWPLLATAGAAVFFLYFFGLTRTGLITPDEPRYAAIGQAMAQTGDWITPRLWGKPWFEKPALLYWMTAMGFRAGWNADLAPRLPVAVCSVSFLAFFWFALRREYGGRAASYAAILLGTSAGWLTYSHIAVTDLPMAALLSAAMLLIAHQSAHPDPEPRPFVRFAAAGVLLGLSVLAKGLVPLVLFVPALWFLRASPLRILLLLASASAVALPWYAMVTARNGAAFIDEFFWKQHFARYVTPSLLHVRPVWFYLPVLIGAIFPWTPLLGLVFRRSLYAGRRERFLLAWILLGFLFFSVSENKLPGYLLPLLPPLAALLGLALERIRRAGWILAICAVLAWLIPAIAGGLPQALLDGVSRAPFSFDPRLLIPAGLTALAIWWLDWRGWRDAAVGTVAAGMTAFVAWLIWTIYPVLDRTVSARSAWAHSIETHTAIQCSNSDNRSWRYGLNYYYQRVVPDCPR